MYISFNLHKIYIRKKVLSQFKDKQMKRKYLIWSNLTRSKWQSQDLNPCFSEAKGYVLSIMCTTFPTVLPHYLMMLFLYSQVYQKDDWVGSFIACMYININQYLLFSPMKSMNVLQADGLQIQKNQWIFD